MKKIIILSLIVFGLLFVTDTYAQQGIGTDLPHKSAALHIESAKRGLLIPRLQIQDLNDKAPVVETPAESLLIYNIGFDDGNNQTDAGFYYWKTDHWEPISQPAGDPDIEINGDDFIGVDENPVGSSHFDLSFKPGPDNNMVLATQDLGSGFEPVWVYFDEILSALDITEGNGITIDNSVLNQYVIELGGTLDDDVYFDLDGNAFIIDGVEDFDDQSEDLNDFYVVIMEDNGTLRRISVADFIAEMINIDAKNGLHMVGSDVYLGGDLLENTHINLGSYELSIDGMVNVDGANKIVVVQNDGVYDNLKTVEREFHKTITDNYTITDGVDNYSDYTQEVHINIDINTLASGTNDIDLTLPTASGHEGQLIYVKIIADNDNDVAVRYLNIKDNTTTITWGAMPHQGWVLKSNGSKWQIIAKN